jgi:hypothetical protein
MAGGRVRETAGHDLSKYESLGEKAKVPISLS